MAKKPEEWLEKVSPAEKTKGNFKLFLGYAPGVGKTYSMLSEGIRRAQPRRRRGHRHRGDARPQRHRRTGSAARSRPAPQARIQGNHLRGDGRGRHHRPPSAGGPGGRTRAHQYSRQQTPQALRGRAGDSRRENRRALHLEHPAHGKHRARPSTPSPGSPSARRCPIGSP